MHEARLVDEAERKAKEDPCGLKMVCLGKAMENYGKTVGTPMENYGTTYGKLWENYGDMKNY